tara:strand:- start:622 stop:933 length:312 start_codon:yes stop_codon:yes gene_type:complete
MGLTTIFFLIFIFGRCAAAKVTDFSLMQCTTTILEAHFEELNSIYGDQVISNLIDWSGTEQALGEEYEIQVCHSCLQMLLNIVKDVVSTFSPLFYYFLLPSLL